MDNNTTSNDEGTHELPEAFTEVVEKDAQRLKVIEGTPASHTATRTSTGLDRVEEGSEESFPGSDPPSSTPPTQIGTES